MPLDAKDYPPGTHIYSFVGHDGVNINIDAEKLRLWCAEHRPEVRLTPVRASIAVDFLDGNVVDLEHVKEVMLLPTLDPIIYGQTGIGDNGLPDVILIDGHHRYFIAWLTREQFIPAYLVPEKIWREFEIIGLPQITEEELRAMPNKAQVARMRKR